MSARKQAKRAWFYAHLRRRRIKSTLTVEQIRKCCESMTRNELNEEALQGRLHDLVLYGTGAVRVEPDGTMVHVPYAEMMAELESIADQLEAP